MTSKIIYVAYGNQAISEAKKSISTLRKHNKTKVSIISNENIDGESVVKFNDPGYGARWAKLNIDLLIKDDIICYLDADTRILGDLSPAFEMIKNGFDMAIAASVNQNYDVFSHIGIDERQQTQREVDPFPPLQLQCGVMFFHRLRCRDFFEEWRRQWKRWGEQDQAAFIRALYNVPLKIWLLGRDWNSQGGKIVNHLFGAAR